MPSCKYPNDLQSACSFCLYLDCFKCISWTSTVTSISSFFCLLILKQMINIFRLFAWQPWIRLLSKTITINDKVIDEKYSKSTFLKKNVSLTSIFFPTLTNDLKHLIFRIKKNTNRTEPFLYRFLCKQQLLYNHFLERPGVIEGINELVSDEMWSYMQWRLKGKCFNFLCSIGQVGICECFSAIGTSTNAWARCC